MTFAVTALTKTYAGVPALSDVTLSVADGEVHALLGANGAGKSTLIKCIGGAIQPSSGTITLHGKIYAGLTPRTAREAGVAVIYQDLSLAGTLSVAENVFLGAEQTRLGVIQRRRQETYAASVLGRLGLRLDPGMSVAELSGAERQVVEIVKALRREPAVLILDEPTAALTEAEVTILLSHVRRLKEEGVPMLYVTHRLDEVFAVADRLTVLRDGAIVMTGRVRDVGKDAVVKAIVGREVALALAEQRRPMTTEDAGDPRCRITELVAPGIGPVSFDLLAGEVVAVFGLVGSGRTELLHALFGALPREGGDVLLDGEHVSFSGPAAAIAAGVALVPSDRLRNGLFAPMSAADNMLMPSLGRLARGGVRRRRAERGLFAQVAQRLHLRPPRRELEARRFSGGNQQKLIAGRWIAREDVGLLLLDEPTQGVDAGARAELYGAIRELARSRRCAVLLTTSDEEEAQSVADRVLVLSRGALTGELVGQQINHDALLSMAHAGERPPAAAAVPTDSQGA